MTDVMTGTFIRVFTHLANLTAFYLLTFRIYSPSLYGPFLWDDIYLWPSTPSRYMDVSVTHPHPLAQFFHQFRAIWSGRNWRLTLFHLYRLWRRRPLTWLTYDWNAYSASMSSNPLDSSIWHRTSVRIHWASGVMVYCILLSWFSLPIAITGSIAFLAHPMATMGVAYIAGRSSAICSLFMLAGVLSVLHGWWMLAAGLWLAAMFAKEEAVIFPGILVWMWMMGGGGFGR